LKQCRVSERFVVGRIGLKFRPTAAFEKSGARDRASPRKEGWLSQQVATQIHMRDFSCLYCL